MKKLVLAVFSAFCGVSAFATTYYADASRPDDSGDGKSVATAKRTLQEAVKLATQDGDEVLVLPGVYNEGSVIPTGGTLPSRVYLTKKITLKSTKGKAVTHIVGRRQSAVATKGCGANAMRCITLADSAKGAIIDGFTIRDGATFTASNGIDKQGGGVWANEYNVGFDYYVCNCTIQDCESVAGGGMFSGTAVSTLLIHNYGTSDGGAGKKTAFVNSVLARNYDYYTIGGGGSIAVNCTIVENSSVAFYPSYGYTPKAYNCIIAANQATVTDAGGNNTGILKNSVCEPSIGYWKESPNSVKADYSTILLGPARGDFRLQSGSAAIGRGDPALLAEISVPAAYANRDYYGKPIDVTAATINAGAVQEVATPQSGMVRVSYPEQVCVDGFPVSPRTLNSYFHTDSCPTQVRVTSSFDDVFRFRNATQSIHYYPDRDGGVWFTMPPVGTALQDLRVDATAAKLYVDKAAANDNGDGKSPTTAKRTIQAAVDAVTADKTVIYVAPGAYDEGGKFSYALSNRVAVTAYDTCIRATGSPEETFIVGAPDPETGGYGYNATRCVVMAKSGAVQGFTLTGGWTAKVTDATHSDGNCRNGGALFAASGSMNSQITDCIVTNNHAAVGSFTHSGAAYRCFATDNPFADKGTYNGTYVSCVFVQDTAASYVYRDNTAFYNCTLYGAAASGLIADTTCRHFNTILHNCGSLQPYNQTCFFWGNALDGNTSFNPTRGDGQGQLPSSWAKLPIDFADVRHGDFRTLPSAALDAAGEAFDKEDAWMRSGGDFDGQALKVTEGRIRAGAVQAVCEETVMITNLYGTVTVDNGRIGENAMPGGKTITVTATSKSRPFLGFKVDGVLQPRGSDTLVIDHSYVGKTIEAVYVAHWYVNADPTVGDDANDGMTPETPKRTLQAVLSRKLAADDTVHAAPGVYDQGEMHYPLKSYYEGDGVYELPSRAVVTNGVTLVADEGPEVTTIVGETATDPDAFGNGSGAMRCVTLAPNAKVIGFTLTGGHTLAVTEKDQDDDKCGGAVLGAHPSNCRVVNCILTGNGAVRGGGVIQVALINCRFTENVASEQGSAGFFVNAYGCSFDHFACDCYLLAFYMKLHNCTFGPDLHYADGVRVRQTFGNPNSLEGDWGGSVANDVFLIPLLWRTTTDVAAFNSVFLDCADIAKQHTTNCVFVADAGTWFNGLVPKADIASPVVGLSDPAKVPALLEGIDVLGNPRVSNGAVDAGAYQSDWRSAYAVALGARRDFTCTAVSPELVETDAHTVWLNGGSIGFKSKKVLADEQLHFEAVVDGNGTLVVELNGETCATFTSSDSPVSTEIPLPSGVKSALSVRYVPGVEDTGSAALKRFRLNFELGSLLILR